MFLSHPGRRIVRGSDIQNYESGRFTASQNVPFLIMFSANLQPFSLDFKQMIFSWCCELLLLVLHRFVCGLETICGLFGAYAALSGMFGCFYTFYLFCIAVHICIYQKVWSSDSCSSISYFNGFAEFFEEKLRTNTATCSRVSLIFY